MDETKIVRPHFPVICGGKVVFTDGFGIEWVEIDEKKLNKSLDIKK